MDPGISVPMVAILIVASGLFSGLTLGLMGLDTVHLKVLIEQPQEDEVTNLQTKCAKKILPIRARGNLLLCTLLVGNVAVNAGISILLADLTSGILGFAISTAFIVIFGEIAPQAICSRYGLIIGSKLVWLMWIIIVMLFLVTYPIAKVLD